MWELDSGPTLVKVGIEVVLESHVAQVPELLDV